MAGKNVKEKSESLQKKIKFWKEQDRINEALISRVIRQSELLNKHIAEHDSLPTLFAGELSKSLKKQSEEFKSKLSKALKRHTGQFRSELENARETLNQMLTPILEKATSEQAEQARKELDACLSRLIQEHQKLQAKQKIETQRMAKAQRKKWLELSETLREEWHTSSENLHKKWDELVETLREEWHTSSENLHKKWNKQRKNLIAIVFAGVLISVISAIISWI